MRDTGWRERTRAAPDVRGLHRRPTTRSRRRLLCTVAIAAASLVLDGRVAATPQRATKNVEVIARNGVVASAHPLASQAGIAIMKAGGNAVDGAVAAAFAIGVAEPNASGIGGDGFMVICLARQKQIVSIDYRSAAPAAATSSSAIPAVGHAAAAVPGTVAGLTLALEKYGTMTLPQVLAPAIRLAEEGCLVGQTLAAAIAQNAEAITGDKPLARILCPTGLPLRAGATLKNPELAASLRTIAAGGRDVFYRGALAGRIAEDVQARGGFITREDLASYRAIVREPVRGSYRGVDLISAPPPGGGIAVIEVLQILEAFEFARVKPFSATHVHLVAEAVKRGLADWGAFVGDPDVVTVPVEGLLGKPYARARAAEILPGKISPKVGPGEPPKLSPSTTSLSTVDKAGNMVALTQTVSEAFGAKVAIEGTGIILNNEMWNPGARGIGHTAPGKRLPTTIAPTILLRNGRPFATLGTPGAARIIPTMALIVSNLVDYGMGVQEAIEAPRFFAPAAAGEETGALEAEARLPPETVTELAAMGYAVKPMREFDPYFGGAHGILVDPKTGRRIGAADPRCEGAAAGY